MSGRSTTSSVHLVWVAWLVLALTCLFVAAPHVQDTGMYYDEAFLAQQGRDFVEPDRSAIHPPSVSTIYLAGRPFPLRNAAYLGSLKSQLLIPSLALFGSSSRVVRITTLATSLLALLFAMLWARQLFDEKTALVMGLLVATDPSFYFFSQLEWGPFTTLLLCRALGLFLLGVGYRLRGRVGGGVATIAGGGCFGLGVYSRADFAVILFAAASGLLLCRRDLLVTAWREHRGPLVAGVVAMFAAASPTLIVALDLLVAGQGMSERGDFFHRARVMQATLDGSQFHRVVDAGGLFDQLFGRAAPTTGFIAILAVATVALLVLSRGRARRGAETFVLSMLAILAASMLMIPGAVRAHHMLNVVPLPQLVVAAAGIGIWRRPWANSSRRGVARGFAALALAALLYGNLAVISQTRGFLEESRGRGRFSHALDAFAAELDAREDAERIHVLSLDWGFHENMAFLTQHVSSSELMWTLSANRMRGRASVIEGGGDHIYLAHSPRYELVPLGSQMVEAVERLASDDVEVRRHLDASGEHVFTSIRFAGPHTIVYDGAFKIDYR